MSHKYIMYDPAEFDKIEIKLVENSMGDDEYCEGQKSNCPEIRRLRADLAAVTEERDRMREALEFYGWAEHWVKQPYERSVIEDDKGRRARAAIEGVKEPAKGVDLGQ